MEKKKLIVIGAGGFSKDVVWAVQNLNGVYSTYDILGYCDDDLAKKGQMIYGYPVLGKPEEVAADLFNKPCFICSIGHNTVRAKVVQRILALGWTPVTIVDPSVMVAESVVLGKGTYIGARAIVSPKATIGNYVLINNHTTIGHDCILGDYAQVAPGGRVSGASILKEGAHVGANAVVAQGKSVGSYSTLGACSFAMIDIPDNVTAVGIPARVTFHHNSKGE
jgi:sugar O-acyltransferase (sialic acid O-acetyltransferase NeuD family)